MFAVRNRNNPSEWQIRQPGARLDHWGPETERATFPDRQGAVNRARIECGLYNDSWQQYAEVVEVGTVRGKDGRVYDWADGDILQCQSGTLWLDVVFTLIGQVQAQKAITIVENGGGEGYPKDVYRLITSDRQRVIAPRDY